MSEDKEYRVGARIDELPKADDSYASLLKEKLYL